MRLGKFFSAFQSLFCYFLRQNNVSVNLENLVLEYTADKTERLFPATFKDMQVFCFKLI